MGLETGAICSKPDRFVPTRDNNSMFDANVRKFTTDISDDDIADLLALVDAQDDEEAKIREIRALLDQSPSPSSEPDVSRIRADPDKRHAYKLGAKIDTLNVKIPKQDHPQNFCDSVQALDRNCATTYDWIKEPGVLRIQDPSPKLIRGLAMLPVVDGRLPEVTRVDIALDFTPKPNSKSSRLAMIGQIRDGWGRHTPLGVMAPLSRFDDSLNWGSGRASDAVQVTVYHKIEDRGLPISDSRKCARFELKLRSSGLAMFDLQALHDGRYSFSCLRGFFDFIHDEDGLDADRRVKKALENLSLKWKKRGLYGPHKDRPVARATAGFVEKSLVRFD